MNTTPAKGLNTVIGYASAALTALAAIAVIVLNSTEVTSLPPWVVLVLTGLAALQERLVGATRSNQAVALTHAAATERLMKPPWVMTTQNCSGVIDQKQAAEKLRTPATANEEQVGPMAPGDLDAIDLSDDELRAS